ncbi:unnamed protein product [marine sediment metagenome]|uniref:Uncharacterized protein n=1 Tax=marine sediment metagenome TaxID=412755 RepID=X1HJL4_9ZZZZ
MKGKVLKRVKEVVDDHNDDYEELLTDMLREVIGEDDDEEGIEENNLLVSGIIRKFEGLKIIQG